MKRSALLLCFLLPFCSLRLAAQEAPEPDWQPLSEALITASTEGKKILVDVYAPWCPWCRKLQNEVYTDETVRRYLANHFIITRLNGDDNEVSFDFKGYTLTPMELAQGFGAEGYPTTVFLDRNRDYITRLPGFLEASEFLQVLRYIASDAFLEATYDEFISAQ